MFVFLRRSAEHIVDVMAKAPDPMSDLLAYKRDRRELPAPRYRRSIREGAGLSLSQVARAVGVSASAVALWEAGRRMPRPEHLAAYVRLLKRLESP